MSRVGDSRGIESTGTFQLPMHTEKLFIPTTYAAGEAVRSDFSLQTVTSTLFRYRFLIIAVSLATIVLAALFTRKVDPTYQAQAMVSVGQYVPPILGPTGHLLRQTTSDRSYVADQLPLLTSYTIAELVLESDEAIRKYVEEGVISKDILASEQGAISAASINIDTMMKGDLLAKVEQELATNEDGTPVAGNRSNIDLDLLKGYLALIDYEHVSNTSMIAITAQSAHPAMAARIANVHAQMFIGLVRAKLLDNARVNLKFLQDRKEEAEQKAESSRKAMLDYAEKHDILVIAGAKDRSGETTAGQKEIASGFTDFKALSDNLHNVTRDRAAAESVYNAMISSSSNGRVTSNPFIQNTEIELANAQAELTELRKQGFGRTNPYYRNIQREVRMFKDILSESRKAEFKDHEIRLRALRDQEKLIKKELQKMKEQFITKSKDQLRYSVLEQEANVASSLLEELTQRLEEVHIHLNSNQSHVRMIDEARAPRFSKARRDYLNLLLGAILGPFMGIALAFALDLLDNTVRTVSDLQRVVHAPLLGIIPRFSLDLDEMISSNFEALPEPSPEQPSPAAMVEPGQPLPGLSPQGFNADESPSVLVGGPSLAGAWSTDVRSKLDMPENAPANTKHGGESPTMKQGRPTAEDGGTEVGSNGTNGTNGMNGGSSDTAIGQYLADGMPEDQGTTLITSSSLVLVSAPHSMESEAFRNVRTCVSYGCTDKPPKLVLVTSGQKHDGKTTVACNLAISMAQANGRTLLIDADLRLPTIHKNFSLSRLTPGLGDYLRGFRDYGEVIFETPIPNLCLMLAGEPCPNPTELVGSKKMAELLELLGDEFDQIIIDSPPITRVADAMLLSRLVEGVVLVIRSGKTPEPVAQNAYERLRQMDATILGTVLNDVVAVPGYRDAEYYYLSEPYYYGSEMAAEEEVEHAPV